MALARGQREQPASEGALVKVRGLAFRYAHDGTGDPCTPALQDVGFDVAAGAFCVIVGPTGCGKSTLLRLLKPEISPRGDIAGSITVGGRVLIEQGVRATVDPRESARIAGFVAQDPEAQIVCDTVRAELAFGLEGLGVAPSEMRRRIAEVAGFLGLDSWMDLATADLSGGQKQLLNLAAVLAMRPRLLLLDEPTAQLDPQSRRRFLDALSQLNGELGLTVMMSTHSPELVGHLETQRLELGPLAPSRPFSGITLHARGDGEGAPAGGRGASAPVPPAALEVREADFRYRRQGPWVLRDASLQVHAGRVHALMGGNGCGKTTMLKLLAGICKPQRGKVRAPAGLRRAYLPQDPKALFSCDSVGEELHEWHTRFGYGDAAEAQALERFGLQDARERHPYDLSGGQQQLLALAKLMLARPRALLLDEPTKGLDAVSAAMVARLLRSLADDGCALVLATHDTALVRVLADEVSLVFDGAVAGTYATHDFFGQSIVYRADAPSRLFGALE